MINPTRLSPFVIARSPAARDDEAIQLPAASPFRAPASAALLFLAALTTAVLGQTAPPAPTPAATPAPATAAPAAQGGRGAPAIPMTDEIRAELTKGVAELAGQIAALKKQYARQKIYDRIADVEVYLNAVKFGMEDAGTPNPYTITRGPAGPVAAPFADVNVTQARAALSTGKQRAAELARGETPWMAVSSVRGYYSKIDGSAQPYQLTLPTDYAPAPGKQYRLDIFEHGRGQTATELPFLNGNFTTANGFNQRPTAPDATRFILQPFGRWCNATRFAGEIDTFEAIASVKQSYPIDENRIVMTGFSMGGASAWHFATHYPDKWAASSAGAGFSETTVFLGLARRNAMPPAYQQSLWHMYDSIDYAINLFNQPMVAYSGTQDGQRQASEAMKAAMAAEGLELERIDGPNVGHTYEPNARLQLIARLDELATKGRNPSPSEIRFTTWMLRYNRSFWVVIDGMEKHWERARANAKVDGNAITLTTANVSALRLDWAAGLAPFAARTKPSLTIDGTALTLPAVAADKSLTASLIKNTSGQWKLGTLPTRGLRKISGLQGPIDDAFMDSFMIVRPTGTAFHDAVGKWTTAEADRAIYDWRESFRGEARVKKDTDIADADIAAHNLVLFGDPSSNAILKRIAAKLPIKWTATSVTVGDKTYPSDSSVALLIFPNPLNPKKYVVLNSGFTFHDLDNNDKMNPKLPDWAVVDITKKGDINLPTAAVGPVGFFNETWQLQGQAN